MALRKLTEKQAEQVGAAITRTRELRGWGRPELARRAGTTQTNIHRMEHGVRGGLSISMVFTLAETLECSWRDVLGPEPGSDGSHSTDWEAGFRAGLGEAHAALSRVIAERGAQP